MIHDLRVCHALDVHAQKLAVYADAVHSSSMALLDTQYANAKRSRGEIRMLLNNYLMQPAPNPKLVARLRDCLEALTAVVAQLKDARDRADEPEARALLRELREVIDAAVGHEQRLAWWAEAVSRMHARAARTVTRRMEGGNAIPLGTAGSPRLRRS